MPQVRGGVDRRGVVGAGVLTTAFERTGGALACDGVPLERIARAVGTPAYVYSARAVREQYARLEGALAGVPHRIHYSVKANSCLALLSLLPATKKRLSGLKATTLTDSPNDGLHTRRPVWISITGAVPSLLPAAK